MPLILLTNDDGITAEGLRCLEESVQGLGDIAVVAPDRERSAISHGLTVHGPIEVKRLDSWHFALNGTPADCVIYALTQLLPSMPDIVISGINHGANLGDDIMYSGTVAGAREASRHGLKALALSQSYKEKPLKFREAVRFARSLVKLMLQWKTNPGICLNVNIPDGEVLGVKITRQGCSSHFPRAGSSEPFADDESTGKQGHWGRRKELPLDSRVIFDQYISITPLQRDQTDYDTAGSIQDEMPRLLAGRRVPRMGLIK